MIENLRTAVASEIRKRVTQISLISGVLAVQEFVALFFLFARLENLFRLS